MSDRPLTGQEVKIDPQRLFCPSHGEHLRAASVAGRTILGIKLFQAATCNPELWKACGYVEGGPDIHPSKINDVTDTKPLCYFVDDDQMRVLFADAEILTVQRCDQCGVPRLAGPYSMTMDDGEVKTVILCLECALAAGRRCHEAYPEGSDAWVPTGG